MRIADSPSAIRENAVARTVMCEMTIGVLVRSRNLIARMVRMT
jgi:hypothetical protein